MKWLVFIVFLLSSLSGSADNLAPSFPPDARNWLDGKPLQWESLKGKVVLMNVWTFGCWNSYRSLPWLVSLQQKYPDLQIIGVHSPEFAYEKDRNRMKETMANYKVSYPQILDDDMDYWKKLDNRYWPSFYIVDKHRTIRGRFFGETHASDNQANQMESLIKTLLNET